MASMPDEQWRTVPGYSDYEVSNMGRVRSWRPAPRSRKPVAEPRMLRLVAGRYPSVVLTRPGYRRTHAVHQLVARAFLGERPEGMETRHLNGDATDNRVANLTYGTHLENVADTIAHGTAWFLRPDVIERRTRAWRRSMGYADS